MEKISKLATVVATAARTEKKAKEIEPGEIYEKAKAILPKEDIDHHETDLYLRVSPKSTELVNSMKYRNNGMISTFKSNIDGDMWYELPFCYPFIERGIPSKEEDEIILRQKNKTANVTKKAVRKYTNMIIDYMDQGILKPIDVAKACLSYMSEDDVQDMAESNDFIIEEEEEEQEDVDKEFEIRYVLQKDNEFVKIVEELKNKYQALNKEFNIDIVGYNDIFDIVEKYEELGGQFHYDSKYKTYDIDKDILKKTLQDYAEQKYNEDFKE